MKELVGEIEMAAARHLVAVDEHGVEIGQAAGRARYPVDRVHHEHKDAKLLAP